MSEFIADPKYASNRQTLSSPLKLYLSKAYKESTLLSLSKNFINQFSPSSSQNIHKQRLKRNDTSLFYNFCLYNFINNQSLILSFINFTTFRVLLSCPFYLYVSLSYSLKNYSLAPLYLQLLYNYFNFVKPTWTKPFSIENDEIRASFEIGPSSRFVVQCASLSSA